MEAGVSAGLPQSAQAHFVRGSCMQELVQLTGNWSLCYVVSDAALGKGL